MNFGLREVFVNLILQVRRIKVKINKYTTSNYKAFAQKNKVNRAKRQPTV